MTGHNEHRNIVDYIVVRGTSYAALLMGVKARIDKGWQPYGSLSAFWIPEADDDGNGCEMFNQPMVKFEEEML